MRLADIRKIYPDEILLVEFVTLTEGLQVEDGEVLARSHNKADIYKALLSAKGKKLSLEYPEQAFKDFLLVRSDNKPESMQTEKIVLVRAAVTGLQGTVIVNLLAGFPWEPSTLPAEVVQSVGLDEKGTHTLERALAIKREPKANVTIASLKLLGREMSEITVNAGPFPFFGPVDGYLGTDVVTRLGNTVLSYISLTDSSAIDINQESLSEKETYGEFDWLQGGPLLEVGFLLELGASREEFRSNFVDKLEQINQKVEIVSQQADLEESKQKFLDGYPWDPKDENTSYVHVWDALVRVQFGEKRESAIRVEQISETTIHVNFFFWGDLHDGWGQKGLKTAICRIMWNS